MRWIYELDIAAVILTVMIIVQFFSIKQVRSKSRRLFIVLLFDALLCGITDLIGIYTIINAATLPLWVNCITNTLYLLCINCVPALYLYYFISAIEERALVPTKKHWMLFVPVTASLLLILTNPLTDFVFYFDENYAYRHGFGMKIMYAISLLYLVMVMTLIVGKRKMLNRNQHLSMTAYLIFTVVAILSQMMVPHLMAVVYALAVSLTMAFNAIQNPLEQINYTTDVFNRSALEYAVIQHMSSRSRCMVFSVKIEDFAAVDSTFGSKFGDMVMREIADFFKSIKGGGMLFQSHRRQFVFLVANKEQLPETEKNIEKINRRFEKPFVVNGITVWLKTTIFQLSYPDVFGSPKDVLAVLEYLYTQKTQGGDGKLRIAGFELIEKIRRRNQIEAVIERAVKNQEFMVDFQPIYSSKEKRFTGVEAVVRLFDENFGFIDHDELVGIAEQNGQMPKIGEIAFEEVCRCISSDNPADYGISRIEFKLTMSQCLSPDATDALYLIMDKYSIDCSRIFFELTESAMTLSSDKAAEAMNAMAQRGMTLILDGYGGEHSANSNLLIGLPFSMVKLDRTFVHAAADNEKALKMLVHTANMLWDLGLSIGC